jgi:chemotaxis protein MotB
MHRSGIPTLFAALTLAAAPGCVVPKARYLEVVASRDAAQTQHEVDLAERDRRIAVLEGEVQQRDRRIAELEARAATLDGQVDALTQEKAELVTDRARLQATIEETKGALRDMMDRKAAAEQRIAMFRDLVARFQTLIDSGRLEVKIVDGRMVVELATDVLFASGRAELSPEGAAAVAEVAHVLAQIPDRRYQVEGHTDDVPIKTAQFPSNWELASARAMTVVRALIDAGVTPAAVSGASYGEHLPVAANDTAEGRAANRRIEITVTPDLSLLPGHDELSAFTQ